MEQLGSSGGGLEVGGDKHDMDHACLILMWDSPDHSMPRIGTCMLVSHGFFCVLLHKESQQAISDSRDEKETPPLGVKSKVLQAGQRESHACIWSTNTLSSMPSC